MASTRKFIKEEVFIENAVLGYKNLSGNTSEFNRDGKRTFCVFLDLEVADALKSDGWNIRATKPRDPDEEPVPFLPVEVSYRRNKPVVVLVNQENKPQYLKEDTVHLVDSVEILSADLVVRPYNWDVAGKTGVKAFLKSLLIFIREDALQRKYAHILQGGEVPEFDIPVDEDL